MNSEYALSRDERILVTGSSGFIGTKVVETLLEYGFHNIRCFVRASSRLDRLKEVLARFPIGKDVELFTGDLLSSDNCRRAADGASIIYHLAAGFDKSFAGAFMSSVLTTRNLLAAFLVHGRPKRFVNVSSFAVYSTLGRKRGATLDETCPLEDAPQERFDAYGFGKLEQEQVVREYGIRYKLPYVILRPGYVFGPGKQELNGRVGINTFGFFIQINGSNVLPLTYVDNCAEAIVLAGLKPGIDGEVFNIVDDGAPRGREFLQAFRRARPFRSVRVPYSAAYAACFLWEKYSAWSGGQLPPVFNRRRCSAEWKSQRYPNTKLKERVGWKPRVSMKQALGQFLTQFEPTKR